MGPKKTRYYQKYRPEWESRKEFEDWLKPFPSDEDKAYCSICCVMIKAHLADLQKHASSKKHLKAIKLKSSIKVEIDSDNSSQEEGHIIVEPNEDDLPNSFVDAEFLISENDDNDQEDNLNTHSKWQLDAIKTLLSHLSHYWKDFQHGLRKKKDIWDDIGKLMKEGGYDFSPAECSKKFRNIKVRYYSVLEKKMFGEKQIIRIGYFDEIHALIGNDPETLAYLECKKLSSKPNPTGMDSEDDSQALTNSEFDIANDGEMDWSEVATTLLLDLLLEFKDWFSSKEDEEEATIWEIIATQMKKDGFSTDSALCKRKWHSLSQLFDHYKTIVNSTGILPLWPYYTRVRHVLNTVNISTHDPSEKVSLYVKSKKSGKAKRLKLETPDNEAYEQGKYGEHYKDTNQDDHRVEKLKAERANALDYLQKMRENVTIWQRLNAVESQVNQLSDHQELQRQTNLLLTQILGELSTLSSHIAPRAAQEQGQQGKNAIIVVPNST